MIKKKETGELKQGHFGFEVHFNTYMHSKFSSRPQMKDTVPKLIQRVFFF